MGVYQPSRNTKPIQKWGHSNVTEPNTPPIVGCKFHRHNLLS